MTPNFRLLNRHDNFQCLKTSKDNEPQSPVQFSLKFLFDVVNQKLRWFLYLWGDFEGIWFAFCSTLEDQVFSSTCLTPDFFPTKSSLLFSIEYLYCRPWITIFVVSTKIFTFIIEIDKSLVQRIFFTVTSSNRQSKLNRLLEENFQRLQTTRSPAVARSKLSESFVSHFLFFRDVIRTDRFMNHPPTPQPPFYF